MSGLALLLAASLSPGVARIPSEQFVRANYVKDDGPRYESGYPRVATGRFRQAWVVARDELSPYLPFYYRSVAGRRLHVSDEGKEEPFGPSPAFLEAVDRVIRCLPQLSSYRADLYAPERVRLGGGQEIITFYLYRLRDAWDNAPMWISSFVWLEDGGCTSPAGPPEPIDIDHGGQSLEVWDVFEFAGHRFLLAHVSEYEESGMRLYQQGPHGFTEALSFWFACLGCE
jgi:hypothetical protein